MHEQDIAMIKALVPVAWADGEFADRERETLEALLDAFHATAEEKTSLREYAKQKRTFDDIPLQDLSSDDRRALLQHAVLMTFSDGDQSPAEVAFLEELAKRLKIEASEAKTIMLFASERAKKHLNLL